MGIPATFLQHAADHDAYQGVIERYQGTVRVPVGVAGPLTVLGNHARGSFPIPLATTEGALVASYHRGCLALNESGGCRSIVTDAAMTRTPCFRFSSVNECHEFLSWVRSQTDALASVVRATSAHCQLRSLGGQIEGNHIYLTLEFTTGDAAGQNMVTIASEALCRHAVQYFTTTPECVYVEANLSGDKKASSAALTGVRGRRVVAEINLPGSICNTRLHVSPRQLEDHWYASAMGGSLAGAVGLQGHYANALAALYIALGQDAACVAESAVGITRMVARDDGLYAAATLPNIIVGLIGGGSRLPDQAGHLAAMQLPEEATAAALAEVIGAVCLAGELSIAASIASGSFARAHRILGRRTRTRHHKSSNALSGDAHVHG